MQGRRYNRETLEIKYKDKSIYDVLEMTVDEGLEFFPASRRLRASCRRCRTSASAMSRSASRPPPCPAERRSASSFAAELSKRPTGRTIYILDEPTTGLHIADVHRLIDVLQTLVDAGNTVVVIEHNLDLIKTADYIIDLGPEGGDKGGYIVATGTRKRWPRWRTPTPAGI